MTEEPVQLKLENLYNALEHIRIAATLHYVGGAFEPEHMRSIANVCIRALRGDEVPALPSPEEIHERVQGYAEELRELFVDD